MALLSRLGAVSVPLLVSLTSLALSQGVAAQAAQQGAPQGAQTAPATQNSTALIGATPEKMLELAKSIGTAALEQDEDGKAPPMIIGRINGIKYGLYFHGCQNGQPSCSAIEFKASWTGKHQVTVERLNAWHRASRYGVGFLNGRTPVLRMSANLDGGVTQSNLEDTFQWWARILPEFRNKVVE